MWAICHKILLLASAQNYLLPFQGINFPLTIIKYFYCHPLIQPLIRIKKKDIKLYSLATQIFCYAIKMEGNYSDLFFKVKINGDFFFIIRLLMLSQYLSTNLYMHSIY